MSGLKFLIRITLLLSFSLNAAYAQVLTPNFYECKGQNVALIFSMAGFASTTHVSLDLGKKHYTADATTLETQTTVMGDLNTITVKYQPDVNIQKASFVIPSINLNADLGTNYAMFKSMLIITTISTPFTGVPPLGIINKSRYVDLTCKGSLVF